MSQSKLFLLHLPTSIVLPALLSWYVGRNLLRPLARSRHWVCAAIVLMFAVGIAASLALIFWSEQDRAPIRTLVTVGFYLLGYLSTAAALLLVRDLMRLLVWSWWRMRRRKQPAKAGPHWVLYGSSWLIGLVAGCALWLGRRGAEQPPTVHNVVVPIRSLPAALRGYRIAQLTDIHLHGKLDRERIRQLVARVNALDVDLIAITGDVVDGPLDDLRAELSAFGALRARDGVYMSVGNHEYYADVDACVAEFLRLGFRVLLNEHRVIDHGPDRIVIAGVTNPQRGMHGARYAELQGPVAMLQSDPRAAVQGAPIGIPRILLAHQPRSVVQARGLGFDLALAGHTHGGQFFPWNLAVRWVFPYAAGLSVDGTMQVYVGRGIGTFGPQLRLGSPAEIAVIELRPANSGTASPRS
jgi:uncharacterized protein